MTAIADTARAAERLGSEALEAALRSAAALLSRNANTQALPRAVRARLHRDAWQIQARFDQLAETKGIETVLNDATILAQDLGKRAVALVVLIDRLISEAERLYGTREGRGRYKRQQVKAALLYAARRGGYDLPWVPSVLEPAVFSLAANILIDFAVAHVNQNALWNMPAASSRTPGLGARLTGPPLLYLRIAIQRSSEWLAGLAWRLVLAANKLSPTLRSIIDQAVSGNAISADAVADLRAFFRRNPEAITAIASVFGIATQQAEAFNNLSGPQKQDYVREIVLIVLRQKGVVGRSELLDAIIGQAITVGIDMTVAIFNRRGLFRGFSAQSL